MDQGHPLLYELNTRVFVQELGKQLGRAATLDDIGDAVLDQLARQGFRWLWLLGVWQTGSSSREIAQQHPDLQSAYRATLEDLQPDDICGSCFAIKRYQVAQELGGDAALARLRQRIHAHGMRLMLDFVPNHVGVDHDWIPEHTGWFIQGSEDDLARDPGNWIRLEHGIFAHGRDPYFPGWTDTLQLNYGNADLQAAMRAQVRAVAEMCDGLRCDMAMLLLPDVFAHTWGIMPEQFWPDAIAQVRADRQDFVFLAEVYWDLGWKLLQLGFDFTYDKKLYDSLRAGDIGGVHQHLLQPVAEQRHLLRFIENHDEERAAVAFPGRQQQAAAVITAFAPGMFLVHEGQRSGRRVHQPMQLCRRPGEPHDQGIAAFYDLLTETLQREVVQAGSWTFLHADPAWDGNHTNANFIAYLLESAHDRLLVIVNYASYTGQCRLPLPANGAWDLHDLLDGETYIREGRDVYIELEGWGVHLFEMSPMAEEASNV